LQPLREGAGFTGWKGHANANLCHNFLKTRMLSFAVRRQRPAEQSRGGILNDLAVKTAILP
ncbi:MAG: hypothetical protein WCD70_16400, partial [Alphaproteobacteria bacterium]